MVNQTISSNTQASSGSSSNKNSSNDKFEASVKASYERSGRLNEYKPSEGATISIKKPTTSSGSSSFYGQDTKTIQDNKLKETQIQDVRTGPINQNLKGPTRQQAGYSGPDLVTSLTGSSNVSYQTSGKNYEEYKINPITASTGTIIGFNDVGAKKSYAVKQGTTYEDINKIEQERLQRQQAVEVTSNYQNPVVLSKSPISILPSGKYIVGAVSGSLSVPYVSSQEKVGFTQENINKVYGNSPIGVAMKVAEYRYNPANKEKFDVAFTTAGAISLGVTTAGYGYVVGGLGGFTIAGIGGTLSIPEVFKGYQIASDKTAQDYAFGKDRFEIVNRQDIRNFWEEGLRKEAGKGDIPFLPDSADFEQLKYYAPILPQKASAYQQVSSDLYNKLINEGYSSKRAEEIVLSSARELKYSRLGESASIIYTNAVSNMIGGSTSQYVTNYIEKGGKVSIPFMKNVLSDRAQKSIVSGFSEMIIAGPYEGGTLTYVYQKGRYGKANAIDVAGGAVTGFLSAGAFQSTLNYYSPKYLPKNIVETKTSILGRESKNFVVQSVGYGLDLGESFGDAFTTGAIKARTSVVALTPSFSNVKVESPAFGKTAIFNKGNVYVTDYTPTGGVFSQTNINNKDFSFVDSYTKTESNALTTTQNNALTFINTLPSTFINTPVNNLPITLPQTLSNTLPNTLPSTLPSTLPNTMPLTFTNVFSSGIPPFFPSLGGGDKGFGDFGFRRSNRKKMYTPSLSAVIFNIKSKKKASELTGLNIRPIIM